MTVKRPTHHPASDTTAFGRFFLPGPTEVHPDVLRAMQRPMIGHRGKEMQTLIERMLPRLQTVFRTKRPVYIASASATGLMEAAVRNGARRRVLSLVNGAFSERFHRIAVGCGLEADALEVPLGAANLPDALRDALRRKPYDAVTVVHSETSTGVLNPIRELATVVHEADDVMLLVDSVTGIAGAPTETDAWQLDFILTGSQKALALPPGLALGVAASRMLERAKTIPHRGAYFDLVEYEEWTAKRQTPNTPALSLFHALDVQLERIERETIEGRWERHRAMAERTWSWVGEMRGRGIELGLLAPEGYRSPTVTCITLPAAYNGTKITADLAARGYTIATGYGKLKDSSIRIGHMGDHTVTELEELLGVLEEVIGEKR